MGIQRAAVLYPRNTTIVDASVDVRLLDTSAPGPTDATQACTATHTQDNAFRTFNPANSSSASSNPVTPSGFGYGLRLSQDMTPTDDTNCDAFLEAQALTVDIDVSVNQSGGTYTGGTYAPQWRAALHRWNPSTDTDTFINGFTNAVTTWDYTPVSGDLRTFKTISATFDIPAGGVQFAAGEILLLQIGLETRTIPNPTLGTATWTYTLRVDSANTKVTWAAGKGMRQACAFSSNLVGAGVVTREALQTARSHSLVGAGVVTHTKTVVASKSFDLVGAGVLSESHASVVDREFDLVGVGEITESRVVVASKSFDLVGVGVVTREGMLTTKTASLVCVGEVTASKTVIASKSFDLVGVGEITETHPVQAFRTANLVGVGEITGTITLPIDEVPTGGGGGTIIRPIILLTDD